MDNGWIKLHRKLLNNPIAKKPTWAWLWVVLLLLANHEDEHSFIWNEQRINLEKGQFVTGRKKLREISGIPETTIERILNYLETGHQIGQQKTTKYRLITILKWKSYQNLDSNPVNRRTTDGHIQEIQELKNNTNTPPKGDIIDNLLNEGGNIQHDFQYVGLEIFDKLSAPANKKGECIRLAKLYPGLVNQALSFSLDYPNPALKWKMFLWKLNSLIKQK